jgi:hypothetical protein
MRDEPETYVFIWAASQNSYIAFYLSKRHLMDAVKHSKRCRVFVCGASYRRLCEQCVLPQYIVHDLGICISIVVTDFPNCSLFYLLMYGGFGSSSPHDTSIEMWRGNGWVWVYMNLHVAYTCNSRVCNRSRPSLAPEACTTRPKGSYIHTTSL